MSLVTCWDLRQVAGVPRCCESCHEDDLVIGYGWLCESMDGFIVCCALIGWLAEPEQAAIVAYLAALVGRP